MARITAPDLTRVGDLEEIRRARLRASIPVAVAVLALVGVLLAGSLALRDLVEFGAWFLAAS